MNARNSNTPLGSLVEPLTPTTIALALAFGIIVIAYVLYQRYFSPLARVPGPFWASLSRVWITKLSWYGGHHEVYPALHRRYGPLVRIAPNEVYASWSKAGEPGKLIFNRSVADPSAVKKIYAAGSGFQKSDWYSVWQGHRKFDLFGERNEKLHGSQRRLVSRAYSAESLRDLETYVEDAIAHFCTRMEHLRVGTIDLGKWVQLFAFDVIGKVTFSKRFGFMDVGEDDGSFAQIHGAIRSASWLGQMPWLFWMNDFLSPVLGNWVAVNARHGSIRNFAVREMAARKDRGSDHKDLLGKLFDVGEEKPEEFDMNAVASMATSNIFAGSDTTGLSTRALVYYLLTDPDCKKRLIDEIDEKRRAGQLSDPVKLEEADNMPYFQACLYEALRCHPAAGMTLPRVVPNSGIEINGVMIPPKTVVGACPWVVHKNKDVFGPDADSFNPDRWLKGDASEMHRMFFTFGAGARMCIGKNIAWMEISKLVPTLFLRYDMELQDRHEWKVQSWWFALNSGLYVTLSPRGVV